jgi:hypothetical protein
MIVVFVEAKIVFDAKAGRERSFALLSSHPNIWMDGEWRTRLYS